MLFISMLVFQLAGALILLLNCSIGSEKMVIKNCFPGTNVVERDDDNNCKIPKDKLQLSAHKIYLNIVAFSDLVAGYLIASLNPTANYETCYTVLGVVGATVILLLIEYFVSLWIAKMVYAKDMEIPYSELEKNDVGTFMTKKELKDMWNKAFDKGNENNE